MQSVLVGRVATVAALGVLACNGTQPPNPPFQLVISGGNAQSWYFNNPLPTPLSVTALDVDGLPVSGVVVTWAVTSGAGAVSPAPSTTDANGIATAIDSIGSSTIQNVSATFAGLPGPVTFTEFATTPPTATTADVSVNDNSFTPGMVGLKRGGTVTWTWAGVNTHNVTFTGGPTPRPANLDNRTTGTGQATFTAVGRYTYVDTNHAGMSGSIDVVY